VWISALLVFITVEVCQAATLLRTPCLQNVTSDSATILWATRERGVGSVRFSADGNLSRIVIAQIREFPDSKFGKAFFQYQVNLKGLAGGREYLYQVLVDGVVLTEPLSFETPGLGPFNFLVFGDSGTGNHFQAALAKRMIENEHPAFVLHTGDLSQASGTYDELEATYFGFYRELMNRSPFFPAPGNHDYYSDGGTPARSTHSVPAADVHTLDAGRYYSFNWGNVHFVSLDSNLLEYPAAADRMLSWLDSDLRRQDRFWKIVYFHHLPYPTGHHLNDPVSRLVRERIVPVLERHSVQLVLTGHEHSYQRTFPLMNGVPVEEGKGPVYITTGGGGGVLHTINSQPSHAFIKSAHHYLRVEVCGTKLTIKVIDIEGQLIEEVKLRGRAPRGIDSVVNAASFTPALAAGSLVTLFGEELAPEEQTAAGSPLPQEMNGTSLSVNGQPLPLLFVSPHQINAQLPYGILGRVMLQLRRGDEFTDVPVTVRSSAPSIFRVPAGLRRYAAILRAVDYSLVLPGRPVKAGEYIMIYLTGLGEVDGIIGAGESAPIDGLRRTLSTVEVQIGDQKLMSSFAGLAPGYVGVYQVNVRVPDDAPDGPLALRVYSDGSVSDPVTLFVRSTNRTGSAVPAALGKLPEWTDRHPDGLLVRAPK
jgi:uncharacterized protein (TIGR03437 family)